MRSILFLLALVATAADAAPSYDYLDVSAIGLGYSQPGTLPDDDSVGARFRSSLAFDDEWFWTFELGLVEYDAESGNLWKTGIGYAFPLDAMDVAVKIEYGRFDFGDAGGGGFTWDAQLRSATWEHFELNAHVGQNDVSPVDDFLRYGVGLVWTPGDSFGVSVEYDLATGSVVDLYLYSVGLRWSF